MSRASNEHTILTVVIAAALSACGDTKTDAAVPAPAPRQAAKGGEKASPDEARQPTTEALPQATRAAIDEALGEYEVIRKKLAADETSGLAEAAGKMAAAAERAIDAAPMRLRPLLESMAKQAKALAAAGTDIEQNRVTFGEVSRAVVGLLVAEQPLQQGRFVFHCPMAKGYKKWVQAAPEVENPFMGKRMLECGTESDWEV